MHGSGSLRADFSNAILKGADLSPMSLAYANLTNAVLRCANLRAVNFTEANLTGANLESANLTDTILRRAELGRTKRDFSIMIGTDLEGAIFNGKEIKGLFCAYGAFYYYTIMPDGTTLVGPEYGR